MHGLKIVKSSKKYANSYCDAMDSVSREGKFLSVNKGYPLPEIIRFIKICRECGYPQYFLINEEDKAVGWCDIVRRSNQPDDVGYLGIGILKPYRNMGWGTKLIDAAIQDAIKRGFNEIRLEVRASNANAIHTYKKYGFVCISYDVDGVTTNGVSEDVWTMSYMARNLESDKFSCDKFFNIFPKIKFKLEH